MRAIGLAAALALAWLALASPLHAEDEPRLVRVEAEGELAEVLLGGFDVIERHGRELRLLAWPGDEARLAELGIAVELLDPAPGRTAAARSRVEIAARGTPRVTGGPPPFGAGSLAGYWTLEEVHARLQQLVDDDVNDVVADQIDSIGVTIQGRRIEALRLGRAVPGPDMRPTVFYSALTHAREPGGMQALLWFVDHLLQGYGSDPLATHLLDDRVILIVPVVNPDGYLRNQNTFFTSGGASFGMWRKNLRDNNASGTITSIDGVDINRNYGYQWGLDNVGSSGSFSAENYRGTAAFSEPETRAQRDAVIALRPVTGMSFHTYSDLLLHPWGWTEAAPADSEAFYEWMDVMSAGSGYQTGLGTRILYRVNGEFNDWCYGETTAKPRAWTWTPEAGGPDDGFWPPPSRILPIAEENLRSCLFTAAIAGACVRVDSWALDAPSLNAGFSAGLTLCARNIGLGATSSPVTATLTALSDGARVLHDAAALPAIDSRTSVDLLPGEAFQVAADDTVTPGRLLRFRVDFVAPGLFSRDTIEVICGTPTLVFADNADAGTAGWTTTSWGVASGDPLHPGPYFNESPIGNYPSSSNRVFTRTAALDLSAGVHAWALYDARWSIEANYDAGWVEASLNGTTWSPVPANGSSLGRPAPSGTQPVGLPIYGGTRHRFRTERADLSDFTGGAGAATRLRFRLTSDVGGSYDGLAIDSIQVLLYDPAMQPPPLVAVAPGPSAPAIALAAPSPNPSRGGTRIGFGLERAGVARLTIVDLAGRRVRTLADGPCAAGSHTRTWDGRDEAGRAAPAGLYLARFESGGRVAARRLVLLR